jgi:hypothetical protein
MVLTRTAALAALVLVAAAAPAGAYVLSDSPGGSGTSRHAAQADHDQQHKTGKPDKAAGQAHADAMKAWAHCVADAASGRKTGEHTGPPKTACGDKPMAPGLAKHLAAGTGPFAPGKAGPKAHGHSSH